MYPSCVNVLDDVYVNVIVAKYTDDTVALMLPNAGDCVNVVPVDDVVGENTAINCALEFAATVCVVLPVPDW